MVAPNLPRYRYRVDVADVLTWVDSWWLAFARENGAAELKPETVLGRSLWEFVAGEETRRLFRIIHDRIRTSGAPMVLPFRCDSPCLKRQMRLTITAERAGQLLYDSVLLAVEPQVEHRVLQVDQPRSEAFLTMCSCCKRSLLEPLGWLDLDEISTRLRLFESPKVPQIRYEICPDCAAVVARPGGANPAAEVEC